MGQQSANELPLAGTERVAGEAWLQGAAGALAPAERLDGLRGELAHTRALLSQALQDGERLATRLDTLLGALPAAVVVLDGQGRVTQANAAAGELLGKLVPGERWFEIVDRAFAPRWDDGHDVSLADGRRVNVATQALPGEPGQILLIRDVTETRRLQEQLAHHRRLSAKTEMAAALAHQIRTPLAAALLALGSVTRARGLDAAQAKSAGRALDSLRQLERLVESMLSFARGAVVEAVPLALAEVLARLREEAMALLGDERFAIACEPTPETLTVHGNADALQSIMLNLITNSRQIIGEDCRVLVTVSVHTGFVTLRFIDNGPGVAPADQARIFEPFHTTRPGGTGLGLSVAQAIARAHGGELQLNPACTTGACFELSLPISSEKTA